MEGDDERSSDRRSKKTQQSDQTYVKQQLDAIYQQMVSGALRQQQFIVLCFIYNR